VELSREFLDREFPSRNHGIQFNHAAVCPLPARAAQALATYAGKLSGRGSLDWREWGAEADALREAAAALIGANESVGGARSVSVVPNTTSGLNIVAQGLGLGSGDTVVTTASEFPANLTPWLALERHGVKVRRLATRDGAFTLEELAAACDAATKLVSVSLVSFHTGFRAPVEAIGALCRDRGIVFGLDAIQGVGAIPVDVAGWGVDFLSADGHKWMLGPEGCGLLFTRPTFRERLRAPAGWSNLTGNRGGDFRVGDAPEFASDATKFEVGALPTPGVYALRASVELLLSLGLDLIGRRNARTLAVLVDGLPKLGFSPVLFGGPPRAGILAARPPAGKDARFFAKRLADSGIAASAREGFLRLSPHVGNDEEESARVLAALGKP
jgi:cysteine desulfurase / selenocysteine lyase